MYVCLLNQKDHQCVCVFVCLCVFVCVFVCKCVYIGPIYKIIP